MPRILGMQAKYPEIGRIRAGKKADKGARQPMEALEDWRFTSKHKDAIYQIAGLYGGVPQVWSERSDEWEVFTESDTLDVQLPGDALFSALEKWGQGGNLRRCDGEECTIPVQDEQGGHLETVPCLCDQEGLIAGESKDACGVTVRLKVVLPEIKGIGIWMLTSGSKYAAMELAARVDLIDAIRMRSGVLVPCRLVLEYREEKRAYEKFTRKYRVPTLEIDESIKSLTALIAGQTATPSIAPTRARAELTGSTGPSAPAPRPSSGEGAREPTEGSGEPRLVARGSPPSGKAGKIVPPHK